MRPPSKRNIFTEKDDEIRKTLKANESIALENSEPCARGLVEENLRYRKESLGLNFPGAQPPPPHQG